MQDRTLLFGIGATKAGTSWLHSYLAEHPACAMSEIKELHYFDALEDGSHARQVSRMEATIERLTKDLARREKSGIKFGKMLDAIDKINVFEQWRDIVSKDSEDPDAYLGFLSAPAGDASLVGDITPAYALLPAARLKQMVATYPNTKFLYVMRDPVSRLWSNVRMVAARKTPAGQDMLASAQALFDKVVDNAGSAIMQRSDYADGLARLEAAVPAEKRKLVFYENLFDQDTIKDICAFLDIPYHPANTAKRVHEGVKMPLDETRRARAQSVLAPQYAAVAARFETLPARWQENMVKG